jgi:hypothetical protein
LRLAGASTIGQANKILEVFLPRFNHRFGVPAAQPESAYRSIGPGLDIDAALCIKEWRKVAKDNTVQYHKQTLQLFAGIDRRSYAGARVEVQERLDGRLVAHYKGKVLTPEEAPPLAASLRIRTHTVPEAGICTELTPYCPTLEDPNTDAGTCNSKPKVIWYEDSQMLAIHRELVKSGMERARQQGKRIGRPRVSERPEFSQMFADVAERISRGELSRRQAASELAIGYTTLSRLLDNRSQSLDQSTNEQSLAVSTAGDRATNAYAKVVY